MMRKSCKDCNLTTTIVPFRKIVKKEIVVYQKDSKKNPSVTSIGFVNKRKHRTNRIDLMDVRICLRRLIIFLFLLC